MKTISNLLNCSRCLGKRYTIGSLRSAVQSQKKKISDFQFRVSDRWTSPESITTSIQFGLFSFLISITLIVGSSCEADLSGDITGGETSNGQGGSLARFAVSGDYLYTVDKNSINVFDISAPANPEKKNRVEVGPNIETIFPKASNLFIGSQEGLYIFDISAPLQPQFLSVFTHVVSCDPVVADHEYAYVTLRSTETFCGGTNNQLDIVDIADLRNLRLIITYPMSGPKGLGIDGEELFVCDDGLKVFDATDVNNLKLKYHFNIEANDVIPYNGNLMVIGDDGLYQYSYLNDTITLSSRLPFIPAL